MSLQSLQFLSSDCRRKSSKMTDSLISALNKELEALLQKNDVEAEKLFRDYVRRQYFRRFFKWFFVVLVISCAIYWVPTLNWNATAIGRLVLIKLVHPFYNWEKWANARCLIEWSYTSKMHEIDENSIEPNLISLDECSTCENLGKFFCRKKTIYYPEKIPKKNSICSFDSKHRPTIKHQFWSFAKQLHLAQPPSDYFRIASKLAWYPWWHWFHCIHKNIARSYDVRTMQCRIKFTRQKRKITKDYSTNRTIGIAREMVFSLSKLPIQIG